LQQRLTPIAIWSLDERPARWAVSLVGLSSEFQLNGFVAATLSLGIVQGGYSTEVLRGAIVATPKGQIEAAYSLGLTRRKTFFLVTLPQMVPLALPAQAHW